MTDRKTARSIEPALAQTDATRLALPPLYNIAGVTALLYLGREVFLPLAISLLLTFALSPIVSFLRKRSVPRPAAVGVTVAFAFAVIALIGFLLASQVTQLAQNLPAYQWNVISKVRSLKSATVGSGVIDRITGVVERVGNELQEANPASPAKPLPSGTLPQSGEQAAKPVPVEIVAEQSPVQLLEDIIVPLVSPFATLGLIIVVVIFMLIERESLRDRFIRLVGASDLHRTTEALQDAGSRVGQYLLMQLVVNATYAIPIAIGLWLIGVPNAFLWGIITLVLRFVPYIGPAIGMFLPMLVTFAALPGWEPLLWVAGLFIVVELISNNIIEPWLYGSRTGLSPFAIIVSAIFWSWLWGPLGLVLSTPLTVCLVVLGRRVPQFEFLDVMLGNEPVLEPHAKVYQRLLAGDPDEAVEFAEAHLQEEYLFDFYEKVGIPALLMAEQDRERGVMSEERQALFARSANTLVQDLEEIAAEEGEEEAEEAAAEEATPIADPLPAGAGHKILAIGGRSPLDDAASAMVAQVLAVEGAELESASYTDLSGSTVGKLPLRDVGVAVLTYLSSDPAANARVVVRRFKRRNPLLRVGLYMPALDATAAQKMAEQANADFGATTIETAARMAFSGTAAVKLKPVLRRLPSRRKSSAPSG